MTETITRCKICRARVSDGVVYCDVCKRHNEMMKKVYPKKRTVKKKG